MRGMTKAMAAEGKLKPLDLLTFSLVDNMRNMSESLREGGGYRTQSSTERSIKNFHTMLETHHAINSAKSLKAVGKDGISNECVKAGTVGTVCWLFSPV